MLTIQREESEKAYKEASLLMPGGVNSPVRSAKALNMTPLVVDKAQGAWIYDVDSRSYLDFCMSWGAIILGHSDSSINEALEKQMKLGCSYGALSVGEIKLASLIKQHMPHIEKLRFVSSGTEATMSALRLARGYTGRSKIVKFSGNYHGHHDALLKNAGSFLAESDAACSLGVSSKWIEDTLVIPYNNKEAILALEPLAADIACVIFEPVCGNMGVVLPKMEFLDTLSLFCKTHKILLIVDEVMTGFRTNFCGAAFDFQIPGDLYCYGKIIGGGLPCAFFGGKQEIMDCLAPIGGVFQAGTLSGNPLAMASGLTVVQKMLGTSFYETLEKKAALLLDPIEAFLNKSKSQVILNRYGSMFTLFFGPQKVECFEDLKDLCQHTFNSFYKYLFDRGVFLSPSAYEANFISISHSDEDLIKASNLIIEALKAI